MDIERVIIYIVITLMYIRLFTYKDEEIKACRNGKKLEELFGRRFEEKRAKLEEERVKNRAKKIRMRIKEQYYDTKA